MLDTVKSVMSVGAGCMAVALCSYLMQVDWQLMLVALYDATYGRSLPEISLLFAPRS